MTGGWAGMSGLRRAAIFFFVLALLLWADGAYLIAKHTSVHGDSGILFGNPHDYLSAGTVVVLSGVLMLAVGAIMWCVDVNRQDRERARQSRERQPAGDPLTREQPGPSGRTASLAAAGDPPTREQPGPSDRTASPA
jgi:hypothetical protein